MVPVESGSQNWGEFFRSLKTSRVQIGLAICVGGGVLVGGIVALVGVNARLVYAIGLAMAAFLAVAVTFVRGHELRQLRESEIRQIELIAALEQSLRDLSKTGPSSDALYVHVRQQLRAIVESRQSLGDDAVVAREFSEVTRPEVEEFRGRVSELLARYETTASPNANADAWRMLLGLSLYEAGLDELSKVGELDTDKDDAS